MEKGRRPASQPWLDRADKVLKADGLLSAAEDLLALDRHTPLHRVHPELDIDAVAIHTYATHLVPDLLQTESYAHAVLTAHQPALTEEQIKIAMTALVIQQGIIAHAPRAQLGFVLDEAVLRRRIGAPKLMREQVEHLLACAELPHLTVQVATLDHPYYAGLTRPTTIVHTPTDRTLVYIDGWDGTALVRSRKDTATIAEHYGHIRAHALTPQDTTLFLKDLASEHTDPSPS